MHIVALFPWFMCANMWSGISNQGARKVANVKYLPGKCFGQLRNELPGCRYCYGEIYVHDLHKLPLECLK